jgi:glycosyltransferase involved in cell wall biosynthesis
MEIFAALSRCEESFGVSVLEASACGLPVVVSNSQGLAEVVDSGVTGFVVPKDDPEQTAAALARLIREPELRARLGSNGRNRIRQRYDWTRNVLLMEDLYRTLSKDAEMSLCH